MKEAFGVLDELGDALRKISVLYGVPEIANRSCKIRRDKNNGKVTMSLMLCDAHLHLKSEGLLIANFNRCSPRYIEETVMPVLSKLLAESE